MDITHLHLHTRDRARSEPFYRDRFGLATCKTAPAWFHCGMRMESPDAVRSRREQLVADGVDTTTPLRDEPAITSFRCKDPDGYAIEICWLPD